MNDILSKSDLLRLADSRVRPSVSIFMPAVRAGAEIQQNPIRLKNLLVEAEGRLVEGGQRTTDARQILAPAYDLLNNSDFWRKQGDGLALFIAPNAFTHYRLPYAPNELVVSGDRFHIRPLLPLFSDDGQFYVLCLSRNRVRVLEASHYEVTELKVENVPQGVAEALKYDQFERSVQWHSATSGRPGTSGDAVYHGHADPGDDAKTQVRRYFDQVDQGLQSVFKKAQSPLVLAGVEYLLSIYREANTYAHVMDEVIPGNCEDAHPQQLREAAWRIVAPVFRATERKGRELFNELIGTGKASAQLGQVLPAAAFGQVGTLYLAQGERRWGIFQPESGQAELHDQMQPGDQDLLDLAAIHTLLNGGSAYVLPGDQMPGGGEVAALYRYAVDSAPA